MSGTRKHKLKINGREVTARQFFRTRCGGDGVAAISRTFSEEHPHPSLALSCHRDTVKEYRDFVKAKGWTGLHFDDNGDLTCTSKRHYVQFLKSQKLHNEDAGYGGW